MAYCSIGVVDKAWPEWDWQWAAGDDSAGSAQGALEAKQDTRTEKMAACWCYYRVPLFLKAKPRDEESGRSALVNTWAASQFMRGSKMHESKSGSKD